jgi:hypothetical protein
MALTKAKLEELIEAGDIVIPGGGGAGATFLVDISTGMIMVTTSNDYTGATFEVNPDTGELEVTPP